jgi:hypothetical protein
VVCANHQIAGETPALQHNRFAENHLAETNEIILFKPQR